MFQEQIAQALDTSSPRKLIVLANALGQVTQIEEQRSGLRKFPFGNTEMNLSLKNNLCMYFFGHKLAGALTMVGSGLNMRYRHQR